MERPALHLRVADEGEIRIKDVGRGDGEGENERKPASGTSRAEQQRQPRGAAHEDRHLGMDRRLSEPGQAGEEAQPEASSVDRFEGQRHPQCREDARPREVGQRQDRVEGGQLGHSPVEGVGLVAEDDRLPKGLDDVPHAEPEGAEEEGEPARSAVLDEMADEEPRRGHEGERRADPCQVEDDDQGQVG